MALRTVRLDDASEQILRELMTGTGKSISTVLKEGLIALQECQSRGKEPAPGPASHAGALPTDVRQGIRDAVIRRMRR